MIFFRLSKKLSAASPSKLLWSATLITLLLFAANVSAENKAPKETANQAIDPALPLTHDLPLTKEEQDWLSQKHTVYVRVIDFPPFQYINNQDPRGIAIDLLKLVAERSGIIFKFTPETRPCKDALKSLIAHKKPDLMQSITHTPRNRNQVSIINNIYSSPHVIYTSNTNLLIHGIDDLTGKTVAVPSKSHIYKLLSQKYPNIKIQRYDSTKLALEAVAFGHADAYIGNLTLGTYLISKYGLSNLKVAAPTPFENHDFPFISRKDWPALSSIIKKTMDVISPATKAQIRNKYISIQYEDSKLKVLLKWILIIASAIAALIYLIIFWNMNLKKQVDEKTAKLETANKSLQSEIKEREQTGQKLAYSEEKYRSLVDTSLVGIFNSNISGEFLYANQAMATIFGFETPEELCAEGILSRWANLKQRDEMIEKLRVHGSVNNRETTAVKRDGQQIQVLFTASLHGDVISAMVMDITERKKTEIALLESEQKFRATFEQAAVGVAHASPEGDILRINEKFCSILGYTKEEMQSLSFKDITFPEDLKADLKRVRLMLSGEKINDTWEKRYVHKNGAIVWVNISVSLLRDDNKEPLYFVVAVQDITSRKMVEEALKESNDRFELSFENANIAINLIDLKGRFIKTNAQMSNMYGYSKEEFKRLSVKDIAHPDDQDTLKYIKQVASGKINQVRLIKKYLHKDGRTLWGEISSTLIKDARDKPLYLIAYILDITEQKIAVDRLKDSEARFRTIYENAPVMIDTFDKDGRCTMWNKECEKVFGWTEEELFAHPNPLELFYPDPEIRQQVIDTILITPDKKFREWRPQRKDGAIVTCLWANFKLPDGNTISLGYDISKRKKSEQILEEYQGKLKSLAVQLTLAEEQERQRIAADLHDNVGQSLALTRLQLVSARNKLPLDKIQLAQFDEMSKSLLKVIQDTRHLIFELSSPSLNEIGLGAAIEEWMQDNIKDKHGIEVELFNHVKHLPMENDLRVILFRNVQELLINAVKHARAKTISVWMEYESNTLCITIQDDGVGFDPKLLEQSNFSKKHFGLFSIHERMSNLGGRLKIKSRPGRGSKFILYLPITL